MIRSLPPYCAISNATPPPKPITVSATCCSAAAKIQALIHCCRSPTPICGPTRRGVSAKRPARRVRLELDPSDLLSVATLRLDKRGLTKRHDPLSAARHHPTPLETANGPGETK